MSPANAATSESTHALPTPPVPDPVRVALFLDVDGTLLEFATHPDAVLVEPSLQLLLASLWQRLGGALAPVSGRPLEQIDRLLGLPSGGAAGLHGAEWRGADGVIARSPHDAGVVSMLLREATMHAAILPGVLVESKPNAIALHFRNAPSAAAAVDKIASALAAQAGPSFTVQRGDHVVELKPAGTDKGDAVARLMHEPVFRGRVPWVVGDDHTDEHAFAVARSLGGTGIIVGSRRPTAASWALHDPAAVRAWLVELLAAIPGEGEA
jgi:trehalose 6-phosphate phosphatase